MMNRTNLRLSLAGGSVAILLIAAAAPVAGGNLARLGVKPPHAPADRALAGATVMLRYHASPTAWRELGEALLDRAELANATGRAFYQRQAASAFRSGAKAGPGHARTWLRLAQLAALEPNRRARAIAFLEAATAAAPDRAHLQVARAQLVLRLMQPASPDLPPTLLREVRAAWSADPRRIEGYARRKGLTAALNRALGPLHTGEDA